MLAPRKVLRVVRGGVCLHRQQALWASHSLNGHHVLSLSGKGARPARQHNAVSVLEIMHYVHRSSFLLGGQSHAASSTTLTCP